MGLFDKLKDRVTQTVAEQASKQAKKTARRSAEAALSLSVAFGLLRIFLGVIGGATWALLNEDHFRVDAAA